MFVPLVLCLFNSWTRQKLGIFSYLWKDFLREIRLVHPSCVLRNVIKHGLCLWFVNFLGRFCYNFLKVNTIWVNLFILFLLLFSFLCMSLFFSHFRSATWFDTFFLLMHFLLLVFGSTCWTVHRSRNHSSKLHSTCTLLTWCSGQTILYSANFHSVVCIRVSIVNVIALGRGSLG